MKKLLCAMSSGGVPIKCGTHDTDESGELKAMSSLKLIDSDNSDGVYRQVSPSGSLEVTVSPCYSVNHEKILIFPPSLNSYERMRIHEVAEELGLHHESVGTGPIRHIELKCKSDSRSSVSIDSTMNIADCSAREKSISVSRQPQVLSSVKEIAPVAAPALAPSPPSFPSPTQSFTPTANPTSTSTRSSEISERAFLHSPHARTSMAFEQNVRLKPNLAPCLHTNMQYLCTVELRDSITIRYSQRNQQIE